MIDRRALAGLIALLGASAAAPAIACAPPPPDTRSPQQIATDVRRQFDDARDLVQIRMLRTATPARAGQALVLHSLKNAVPPGSRLQIDTMPTEACGYGNAPRGSRYLIYVMNASTAHFAPLGGEVLVILRDIGLLPPDWR